MQLQAVLVVYEPFNGYAAGQSKTQAPNANTLGLNSAAAYTSAAAGSVFAAQNTGLSFSDLQAAGGSLLVTANGTRLTVARIGDYSMGIASAKYLLAAGLVALSLRGSLASVTVTIEDFSKPAPAAYVQYGGDLAPAGSALLPGWEMGGRYFRFEDLAGDRMMAAVQTYSGLDVGSKLALTSSEYRPTWDAAQASEALNLAEFDELQFHLVNRVGIAGTPTVVFTLTMYYYDASDSVARTATVLSTNGGVWAVNETKTFTVATNAIAGFDKAADPVYGFRLDGYIRIGATYGPIAWTKIAITRSAPELTPPNAVTNLATADVEPRAVRLTWIAPTDPSGIWDRAVSYDVRYSTAAIDEANWEAATQASGEPTPGTPGTSQTMLVSGLAPETDYWFAVKSTDTCGNVSALSNVPSPVHTGPPDITPPAAVSDLSASDVHPNSLVLHWTATGDDGLLGQAASYDLRYSLSPINEANFTTATSVATTAPKVSGSAETLTVHNLAGGVTYYFALKVIDEWPLASGISNVLTVTMPAPDAEAPYAITDLHLLGTQSSAVHVSFTAPADRGSGGVQGYEVRYSTSPIDAGNWGSAALAAPAVAAVPGTTVNVAIRNLVGSRTYYVGVKSLRLGRAFQRLRPVQRRQRDDPPADHVDHAAQSLDRQRPGRQHPRSDQHGRHLRQGLYARRRDRCRTRQIPRPSPSTRTTTSSGASTTGATTRTCAATWSATSTSTAIRCAAGRPRRWRASCRPWAFVSAPARSPAAPTPSTRYSGAMTGI